MRWLIPCLVLVISACASDTDNEDDSVLLDASKQPIDAAEAVEDTLLEAQEQRDRAIEDAED